jgi:hypothetical protein
MYFKNGSYNLETGEAQLTKMKLPFGCIHRKGRFLKKGCILFERG